MDQPVQPRAQKTRARLLAVAEALVAQKGYEALRVEDVVQTASVAKGTFFAHFRDKDALMELLIGAQINAHLDRASAAPRPETIDQLIETLRPLHSFVTSERYVFDLIQRYSGAAAIAEIGPIAETFERYFNLVTEWVSHGQFRTDIPAQLLAEGVQAFAIQAMSLTFCALHSETHVEDRLRLYLNAWMRPPGAGA